MAEKRRAKWAVLTIHQSCEWLEGRSGWSTWMHKSAWAEVHTSQRDICTPDYQGLQQLYKLNPTVIKLFCDWGRRIKPKIDSWQYIFPQVKNKLIMR